MNKFTIFILTIIITDVVKFNRLFCDASISFSTLNDSWVQKLSIDFYHCCVLCTDSLRFVCATLVSSTYMRTNHLAV